MGKNKDKISKKKQQKLDQIDNNYLTFDSRITAAMIMCGIATGVSCLFFAATSVGVYLYIISVFEKTSKYVGQAVFVLVCCGIATVGSLVTSIIAKVKCRKSNWAVTNIVIISINLVVRGLIAWFFIWLVNTYGA
jgi:hypothetical protein